MLTSGDSTGSGYRRNLIPTLTNMHNQITTDAGTRRTSIAKKRTPTVSRKSTTTPTTRYADMIRNNEYQLFDNPNSGAAPRTTAPVVQRNPVQQYGSSTATGAASQSAVTDWIDELRSSTSSSGGSPNLSQVDRQVEQLRNQITPSNGPNLPAQINLDQYRTEMATIEDIANKYGFDYSRDYAEQQAAVLAQAQRDEIASSRERQEYELEAAQTDLEHDYFQQYLQQRQDLVDSGLNAGIAAERDLRLGMNMQYALADILANNQLYNQELDRRLATISAEEAAYADQLYNERLQQGFGNAMDYSRFMQSENQFQADMAMQQRAQQVEEVWREYEFNNMSAAERESFLQRERQMGYENAWREYEFNNMSAAERAKLVADAERFGMEMAWERHRFDAGMAFEAGYSGFNDGSGGGAWQTSKGEPPTSFKNHLSTALNTLNLPSSWTQPMSELIARESTWNPNAKNPNSSAHGYGQFLTQTRRDYERRYGIKYDTPVNQLILTLHYVKDRYGSPQKALEHHNKNNWY